MYIKRHKDGVKNELGKEYLEKDKYRLKQYLQKSIDGIIKDYFFISDKCFEFFVELSNNGEKRNIVYTFLFYSMQFAVNFYKIRQNEGKKVKIQIGETEIEQEGEYKHTNCELSSWTGKFPLAIILRNQEAIDYFLDIDMDFFKKSASSNNNWMHAQYNYYQALFRGGDAESAYEEILKAKDDPHYEFVTHDNKSTGKVMRNEGFVNVVQKKYFPVVELFEHARKKEEKLFNDKLAEYLLWWRDSLVKGDSGSLPHDYFHCDATAACVYAKDQGLAVAVESDYIPKWLIEGDYGDCVLWDGEKPTKEHKTSETNTPASETPEEKQTLTAKVSKFFGLKRK